MTQITVRPTQGFTTPPADMAFTATIREIKGGGIHGKSNYGATEAEAEANLVARLQREGYQFEDDYEPNFKGFISTVTAKEIATIGLVVLMFITIWIAA